MDGTEQNGEEQDVPPRHLFERLSYLSGYTWDQSIEPFHSVREHEFVGTAARVADC